MSDARKLLTTASSEKRDEVDDGIDIFTDRRNHSEPAERSKMKSKRKRQERRGLVEREQYRQGWWLSVRYVKNGVESGG